MGYSMPLGDAHFEVLRKINQFYTINGKRPRVLDVGCGFGIMTEFLYCAGANVVAIDFVKENAIEAKNRFKKELANNDDATYNAIKAEGKIKFLHADIMRGVIADSTGTAEAPFDFIWCYSVQHLISVTKHSLFYQKLKDNLVPGGIIYSTCQAPLVIATKIDFQDNCAGALSLVKSSFDSRSACRGSYITYYTLLEGVRLKELPAEFLETISSNQKFYMSPDGGIHFSESPWEDFSNQKNRETWKSKGLDIENAGKGVTVVLTTQAEMARIATASGLTVIETKGINAMQRFVPDAGFFSYLYAHLTAQKPMS